MLKRCKTNIKYILPLLGALLLTAITFITDAKYKLPQPFFKLLTSTADTTIKGDTIINTTPVKDTSIRNTVDSSMANDTSAKTITVDTLNFSKDSIDSPIEYSAEDSGVLIIKSKQFMLYGKAKS